LVCGLHRKFPRGCALSISEAALLLLLLLLLLLTSELEGDGE